MAHDPSKSDCSDCKDCKQLFQDGVEIGRYCKIDGKSIEFWGTDVCPNTKICDECGKINTEETTTKGYFPSEYRYCDCGNPIEF